MKKWNKPEMIDIDVKLTKTNGVPEMSGGLDTTATCHECEHPITHPEDFYHNGNHKGWCSYFKKNQ